MIENVHTGPVAVLGGSGFVGSAALNALSSRGVTAYAVTAPRIPETMTPQIREEALEELRHSLRSARSCINAAGVSRPNAMTSELHGPNTILPSLIAEVTSELGVRFIHVSSAAVQGRASVLDSSSTRSPFSAYSSSKAAGEVAVLDQNPNACVYRPPGVHGHGRDTTSRLVRLASSRLAAVANPGDSNSPQAHIENVADALAFLATMASPPQIVHHPSEGLTTKGLLELLGGKPPRLINQHVAHTAVRIAFAVAAVAPGHLSNARKLEILLIGQSQAPSWLTSAGWRPSATTERWRELRNIFAADLNQSES